MSTKPPATVQLFASDSLERVAYDSVSTIPTEEPNDRNRLGYHIWRWLQERQGTIEHAIVESGARVKLPHAEAARIITESLRKTGISS